LRSSRCWLLGKGFIFPGLPSRNLSLPSRVSITRKPPGEGPRSDVIRLPPMRFLPLRRIPGTGQPLLPGIPLPGSGASSAFLTLARLSSAQHLPALFHAGPARGVSPFRADFHSQSRTFFRRPIPSCGWSVNLRYRVLIPAGVLASAEAGAATLLGFCLPRGLSLVRRGPCESNSRELHGS
jgi:hypothetical protein